MSAGTKYPTAGFKLGATTGHIVLEGDRNTIDVVPLRTADDLSVGVTGNRTTARIANTSDGNASHGKVGCPDTDHLATMGSGIAQSNHFAHFPALTMFNYLS